MALQSVGLFLRVTLVDQGGNKSNLNLQLNPSATAFASLEALGGAAGTTRIADILADLAAVTSATIIGYSIGEAFAEDTEQFGAAGSEVEELAVITARIDGELKKSATVRIPAPDDTIFANDGSPGPDANKIDTADNALLAWMRHFQASVTEVDPFTGCFLISDGESLQDVTASNISGKRIHRGSTKG